MLIDWTTVIAQIINFLILVLLLRRFLYGPIIQAMEEREAKIRNSLEEARRKEEEAGAEIERYQQKSAEMERRRGEMLREAEEEATELRKKLQREARAEVEESRDRWRKALDDEKDAFLRELRQRVGHETYQVIRQALADLADAGLEERMVRIFLSRLEAMPDAERAAVGEALGDSGQAISINSAFELTKEARAALGEAVTNHFPNGAQPQFRTLPHLICGIELVTPGYRLAWSIRSYLDDLETQLAAALAEP